MSTSTAISTTVATTNLVDEGKALAEEWKKISKADKGRFTRSIKDGGFDNRLGKLMLTLRGNKEFVDTATLKSHGIQGIDKRRRSEALWFAVNEAEAFQFVKASKKGFTSLSALQRAMKQAAAKAEKDEPATKEGSDVGPDTEGETEVDDTPKAEPQTASDIALAALIAAETNGVSVNELLVALKDHLELLDIDIAA